MGQSSQRLVSLQVNETGKESVRCWVEKNGKSDRCGESGQGLLDKKKNIKQNVSR